MANYQAIKAGNYSDATIWETGVVPTTGDTAYPNGVTVTIDQNVNANLNNGALASTYKVPYNVVLPLTSNNDGSGFIASTNATVTVDAYKVFDNDVATGLVMAINNYVIIKLPIAKCVKYFGHQSSSTGSSAITLQGSDDGIAWSATLCSCTANATSAVSSLNATSTTYLYYKITVPQANTFYGFYLSEGTSLATTLLGNVGGSFSLASNYNVLGNITTGVSAGASCLVISTATGTVTLGSETSPIEVRVSTTTSNMYGVSIVGNTNVISYGTAYGGNGNVGIRISSNGTLVHHGDCYGGNTSSWGIYNVGTSSTTTIYGRCFNGTVTAGAANVTGILNIIGTQTQSGTSGVAQILNSSTGTLNIIGDCLGSTVAGGASTAYLIQNTSSGIVNITGNITMFDVSLSATLGLIQNTSTGYIKVTGNVTGGSVANTINISNTGVRTGGVNTAKVEVTGFAWGGTHGSMSPAIYSITDTENVILGECKGKAFPALYSTHASAINKIGGNITTTNSVMAYYTLKILCTSDTQVLRLQEYIGNTDRDLVATGVASNFPPITKTRSGIVYGNSDELVGTNIIPPKNTVVMGVSVDDTVGTGVLIIDPTAVWNVAVANLTTVDSIGNKIKHGATVASVGAQITALK